MKRKVLSVMLATAMTATLFAGCGDSSAEETNSAAATSDAAETDDAAEADDAADTDRKSVV